MLNHRRSIQVALITILVSMGISPVRAQWTHGNYSVSTVVSAWGNYSYSANPNYGIVDAVFPSGSHTYSEIKVRFAVTWTYPGPPRNATITYHGQLIGSAGSGSKG